MDHPDTGHQTGDVLQHTGLSERHREGEVRSDRLDQTATQTRVTEYKPHVFQNVFLFSEGKETIVKQNRD